MKTAEDFKTGQILLIDKPLTWSSFQAVNKVRWVIRKAFDIKKIKVGHAGTLDPLASGVLVVAVGKKYTKNGELKYLVKWLGYSNKYNTWEPVENLEKCMEPK